MAEDIPGDARLLTYAELGELLGIEPESAKRRAVRAGWRRVPGNEGRTLVAVPRTAIPEHPSVPRTTAELGETSPGVGAAGRAGDIPGDIAQIPRDAPVRPGMEHTLSRALDDLREALRNAEQRLVEAEGRAGRAEARADAAQGLADRRGEELAEVRERLGRAEGESETLREQLKAERNRSVTQIREVEAARDSAKAELAEWTAGGPLARAVRALVFRRGRS
jgi:hypothetical protein